MVHCFEFNLAYWAKAIFVLAEKLFLSAGVPEIM
jgi:hypothetical protein